MCVRVRARVRVCLCARARVCVCVCVFVCVCKSCGLFLCGLNSLISLLLSSFSARGVSTCVFKFNFSTAHQSLVYIRALQVIVIVI